MLAKQPCCSICTVKLVVAFEAKNLSRRSNAAIIKGDRLICFQCHRVAVKKKDFVGLSFSTRWKKHLDHFTSIPTLLHRIRKRWIQFLYFKVHGGVAHGVKPKWLDVNNILLDITKNL